MKKVILLTLLILNAGCSEQVHRLSRPVLGTIVNVSVIGPQIEARNASEKVFEEIKRIEKLMSPYQKTSSIYKINSSSQKHPVKIDEETFNIILKSIATSEQTGGAFDITFASMAELWNYKDKNFKPPVHSRVKGMLPLVNYRNILLNKDSQSVFVKKKGVRIGLGGIAKGYAIQKGIEVLKECGILSGIVEAGGDLQVLGLKNGKPWVTGLMHPRENRLILSVALRNGDSIATSGDYERFVEYRGKRFHHIIDPKNGYPAQGMASVSVISKDPILCDAYATAFFIMGVNKTREFLKNHKDISVILIDSNMNIYASSEQKGNIRLFEDVSINWI